MASATKKMLSISLKELLSKNTLDNITINNITDLAGVSRKTFYYHFQDIYDLLEWTLKEDLEEAMAGNNEDDTWQQALLNVFNYCLDNRDFVMNTNESLKREALEEYLGKMATPTLFRIAGTLPVFEQLDPEDVDFIVEFYSYGVVGIIMRWIGDQMDEDPEPIVDRIDRFFSGSIEKLTKS